MRRTVALVALILLTAASSGCLHGGGADTGDDGPTGAPGPYTDAEVAFIVDGEETGPLSVEVSDTRAERVAGLMNRESLPEGAGMLFVYSDARERSFWMKNTRIPLDILFVGPDMRVLNVEHASPEPGVSDENLTRYTSDGRAMYVVETERGYANRTGVSPGDRLVIRR